MRNFLVRQGDVCHTPVINAPVGLHYPQCALETLSEEGGGRVDPGGVEGQDEQRGTVVEVVLSTERRHLLKHRVLWCMR